MKRRFHILALAVVFGFCSRLMPAEVTVRGFGIAKQEKNQTVKQLVKSAMTASRAVGLANAAMLRGAELDIKDRKYELTVRGKAHRYRAIEYRKISDIYFECGMTYELREPDNTKEFGFSLEYDSEPELSAVSSALEYNRFVSRGITTALAEEIIAREKITGPARVFFDYLFIDKKLGGKNIPVNIRYSIKKIQTTSPAGVPGGATSGKKKK